MEGGELDHFCHIFLYWVSICFANAFAWHSPEVAILALIELLIWARAGRFLARAIAFLTYSSGVLAAKKWRPRRVNMLRPTLDAWHWPMREIVGTPIHRASQVVVVPW